MMTPSWSPISNVCINILPLPDSSPVIYESPIMTSHEWYVARLAEEGAQLETKKTDLVAAAHCELCDIGIGPDHLEQELFVYPVYGDRDIQCIINGREHLLMKEDLREIGGYWFLCCGGCARSRRRQLPESYCLFDYRHWTTTLLLQNDDQTPVRPATDEDFQAIWLAKDAYRAAKLQFFQKLQLAPLLISLGFPLRAYFSEPEPARLVPEPVPGQDDVFIPHWSTSKRFTMRTPTPMLAS